MADDPANLAWPEHISDVAGVEVQAQPTARIGATYARMSQYNPTRIEDQQSNVLKMFAAEGIALYDHYADDGISGFKRERRRWIQLKIDAGLMVLC